MAELSSYAEHLLAEEKTRYKAKISELGEDPYLLTGSYDIRQIPYVSFIDILQYLVLKKSAYTDEEFRAYKSIDAYKNYRSGFLKSLEVYRKQDFCVLLSQMSSNQCPPSKAVENVFEDEIKYVDVKKDDEGLVSENITVEKRDTERESWLSSSSEGVVDTRHRSKGVQTEGGVAGRGSSQRETGEEEEEVRKAVSTTPQPSVCPTPPTSAKVDKEMKEFYDLIDMTVNSPFVDQHIQEGEDIENSERIMYIPAKRFSNFGYHPRFDTYIPFTVNLSYMKLATLKGIDFFPFLSYLNASHNLITEQELKYLKNIDDLIALILSKNSLTLLSLPKLRSLQLLDVSDNDISSICSDLNLPKLESLLINYNILKELRNLKNLGSLKFLSAKHNKISDLNTDWPKRLTHLYLNENRISDLSALGGLSELRVLHLRRNGISLLRSLPRGLSSLEYLNLRENRIGDPFEARYLTRLTRLRTLLIIGNPCTEESEAEESYRSVILSFLPYLRRLDKEIVSHEERQRALLMRRMFVDEGLSPDDHISCHYDLHVSEEQLSLSLEPHHYEEDPPIDSPQFFYIHDSAHFLTQ